MPELFGRHAGPAATPLRGNRVTAHSPPHPARTPLWGRWEPTLKQACSRINESATCVQRFDDSLNSAIRTTYRISLRSSSLWEPRHPLLKVVMVYFGWAAGCSTAAHSFSCLRFGFWGGYRGRRRQSGGAGRCVRVTGCGTIFRSLGNDPSAGSPTETLLRLLLPLNNKVYSSSHRPSRLPRFSPRSRDFTGLFNR